LQKKGQFKKMTAFARVTAEIDALDIKLCPAAQFLKRFLLRKKPQGKLVDLDLEEFRKWTGQQRSSGQPFCWKWIRQAFNQLIEFGLLKVEFHCGGRRWWKVRVYYLPPTENENKTSFDKNETSQFENITSQKLASNLNNFVLSLVDKKDTTDPSPTPHPVLGADGKEDLSQNTCSSLERMNFTDLSESGDCDQESNSAARVNDKNNTNELSWGNKEASVNSQADTQLEQLDELGVRLNSVLEKLVRTTQAELVEMAIAVYQSYKRNHHVKNPAGLIVAAIKNGFKDQQSTQEVNFPLWYQRMRDMGYITGHLKDDNGEILIETNLWSNGRKEAPRPWKEWLEKYSLDVVEKMWKRSKNWD
jgi:hypothetical protein